MKITITGIADVNRILGDLAENEAKNLLRATTLDVAKTVAQKAIESTPDDPRTTAADLKRSIKWRREKGTRARIETTVRVTNIRRNFFWRFLEYGDGPDKVAHAMFGKALEAIRPDIAQVYIAAFAKKLTARLVRERKKVG